MPKRYRSRIYSSHTLKQGLFQNTALDRTLTGPPCCKPISSPRANALVWIYTTTHAHVLLRIPPLRAAGKRKHIEDDEGRLSKSRVTVDDIKGMAIGLTL